MLRTQLDGENREAIISERSSIVFPSIPSSSRLLLVALVRLFFLNKRAAPYYITTSTRNELTALEMIRVPNPVFS